MYWRKKNRVLKVEEWSSKFKIKFNCMFFFVVRFKLYLDYFIYILNVLNVYYRIIFRGIVDVWCIYVNVGFYKNL